MTKRVAIIGAGPAGLVAAKECLEQGLDVTVFEKEDHLGGLWNAGAGTWPGMQTNLSKDSCAFPDFPWPEDAPLFPAQFDVVEYLESYAQHFGLYERAGIHFNTPVENVSRLANDRYCLMSNRGHESFDHMIVASGFFNTPYIPEISGEEHFGGAITHSAHVGLFEEYRGKNVAVLGNAFSGCDIAAGLMEAGANVTHIFRRPVWVLSRMLQTISGDEQTLDSLFYRFNEEAADTALSRQEKYRLTNNYLADLCAQQSEIDGRLYIDPDSDTAPHVSVASSEYLKGVASGQIKLVKRSALEVSSDGRVCGEGNDLHEIDHIIAATGFETRLPFLGKDILSKMFYASEDRFAPVALHEGMWAKDLPNMACVGMYRGPFFLTMALQAKWAAKSCVDPSLAPSAREIEVGVENMLKMRALEAGDRPQFPFGEYVDFVQRLAAKAGVSTPYQDGQRVQPSDFGYAMVR